MSKQVSTLIGLSHGLLKSPERVPFRKLRVDTVRFQVRSPQACNYVQSVVQEQESLALTASLVGILKRGGELDPIVVWEGPQGDLWVIDGHHRYEALQEVDTPPGAMVWVQRIKGVTEASARHFALDVNKRSHLNMHPKENLEAYWKLLLSGEAEGSVRGRVIRYGISKSTVQNMGREAPRILEQLRGMALSAGVECDTGFIRANAPAWKTRTAWCVPPQKDDRADANRKTIERIVRSLTVRFGDDVKVHPEAVLQAFEEFIEGATGRPLSIRQHEAEETDEAPEF